MTAYDKEIVEKRLFQLEETLDDLKKFQKYSKKEFIKDFTLQWGVERGLQLAIQQIIDIGSHLLVSLKKNNINEYADVGKKMGKHGMVSDKLSEKLVQMIKFRNLLVYEYAAIDAQKVYEILISDCNDFRLFIQQIKKFLLKK